MYIKMINLHPFRNVSILRTLFRQSQKSFRLTTSHYHPHIPNNDCGHLKSQKIAKQGLGPLYFMSTRNYDQMSYEELLSAIQDAIYRLCYVLISDEDKMELAALFQQATIGACQDPKPVRHHNLELELKHWEQWKDLGSMSKEDAARRYLKIASKYV